jgi:two-component system, NtrC family, sensor histidine kinase PilS
LSLRRRIVDIFQTEVPESGPEFRRRVEWLMLLRLVVTTLLLGATISLQLGQGDGFLVQTAIPLYVLIGTTFLLGLLYAVALPRIPNLWGFSFFQVMVDVAYFTALVYFTGGAYSVFTLIYIFPIISSGILHLRRGAMVTASVASILLTLLITLQYLGFFRPSDWPWISPWSGQTPGYFLWLMVVHFTIFFLVALLAGSVTVQLQRTRKSLDESTDQYKRLSDLHTSIVRSIDSGIITTDQLDKITFVNNAGSKLLGKTLAEIAGIPVSHVFPAVTEEFDKTGSRRRTYLTVQEIQGDKIHLEITISDLRDSAATPRGRLVIFQDVTELKRMEERVKASERQTALVRVAAGMAHEIRNPLAAVRGATELLSYKADAGDDDRRLLNIVIRESDRLNKLLGDFLVTVSPGRNKKDTVLLTNLVQGTLDLFSQEPRVNHEVAVESVLKKGVEVEGDSSRLKQMLWNLLSNALEATPDGGAIRITLESRPEAKQAVLAVQDSGGGIPRDFRERMFEPFATTKEGGTGLGLSLVLSIVEAHEGTMEVDSEPGAGTVLTVYLPLVLEESADLQGVDANG